MSRLDGRSINVETEDDGRPIFFTLKGFPKLLIITDYVTHWTEWIGIIDGEPERNIWQVETPEGTCELHHICQPTADTSEPTDGKWILFRWDD